MTFDESCRLLRQAKIENPDNDVRILLSSVLGVSEATLRLHPDTDFSDEKYLEALKRRASHEPLQYVLGEWDFFGQHYLVSPDCLIPRSDTEILVESAIKLLPKSGLFFDLCTGSGCIAISLLAERPDAVGVGIDLFESTLNLAVENAKINRVENRFFTEKADVLSADFAITGQKPVMILCNPPYIPTKVIETLTEEVKREPIAALDGGEDGLTFYKKLIPSLKDLLAPGGTALFEIGYDQAFSVSKIAASCEFRSEIYKDLCGNDRMIFIQT